MEVSLSKDGWHRKLQQWTFGSKTPEFNSLCPFFWTTVFCLLVSPVVATVKYGVVLPLRLLVHGFEALASLLMDGIEFCVDLFNVNVCQPIYEHKVESISSSLTDDEAYELYIKVCYESDIGSLFSLNNIGHWSYKSEREDVLKKTTTAILDQLKAWQNKNPDWESRLTAARAKWKAAKELQYEQYRKDEEAKKVREARVKKFFTTISLYTKYPLSLVLGVVAIYLLYGLALVGLWLWECSDAIGDFFVSAFHWTIGLLVNNGLQALGVLGGIVCAVVLLVMTFKLLSRCTLFHSGKQGPFSKFMRKFGYGVYSFVEFFVVYAKAAKQNYCPRISWK